MTPGAPIASVFPLYEFLTLAGVVFIEWVILKLFMGLPLIKALIYAIFANIVSTSIGYIISIVISKSNDSLITLLLLPPLISLILITFVRGYGAPLFYKIILLSFIISLPLLLILNYLPAPYFIDWFVFDNIRDFLVEDMLILYGFATTLIIEGALLYKIFKKQKILNAVLLSNMVSYLMLVIIVSISEYNFDPMDISALY